jgi:hypothetical protein
VIISINGCKYKVPKEWYSIYIPFYDKSENVIERLYCESLSGSVYSGMGDYDTQNPAVNPGRSDA